MNFHSDEYIMNGIQDHYNESLEYFPQDRIVGIFCQGSTNYGLDTPNSDIDTKLIVVPTFEEIAFNKSPVSTTHVRENDEHIDFKDLRLMLQTFRKQNLNFIEILFTSYFIVNPNYAYQWSRLVSNREKIARYNPFLAVKAMRGVALEKYHAMEHEYPSKIEVLKKYGYDPKQLHHLIRVEEFLSRYIAGEPYKDCMTPRASEYLLDIKAGHYDLNFARDTAKKSIENIDMMSSVVTKDSCWNTTNEEAENLLVDVQREIMRDALKGELNGR